MHLIASFLLALSFNMHTLTVQINDVPSNRGQVLVTLFKGEAGFPSNNGLAYRTETIKIENGKAVAVFKNLPPGHYALASFHDENSNGKLDTNWMGIPQEAYGASNNIPSPFSAPKYKDARIEINADMNISIYLKKFSW